MPQSKPALYLRCDGALLLARGESAIELQLTPEQLLQLGIDCLRTATSLSPGLLEAAYAAMETTYVLPMEAGPWSPVLN